MSAPEKWERVGSLVRTLRNGDGSGGELVAEVSAMREDRHELATRMAALPDFDDAAGKAFAAFAGRRLINGLGGRVGMSGLTDAENEALQALFAALKKARGR